MAGAADRSLDPRLERRCWSASGGSQPVLVNAAIEMLPSIRGRAGRLSGRADAPRDRRAASRLAGHVTSDEIRERFLSYFDERDHQRLPSAPLVPAQRPVDAADQRRACTRSSRTSSASSRRRTTG